MYGEQETDTKFLSVIFQQSTHYMQKMAYNYGMNGWQEASNAYFEKHNDFTTTKMHF